MGFASAWLEARALFPEFITEAPERDTDIIVVVPSYAEPEITKMLDSLAGCNEPSCKAEVIIIVNAPDDAPAECLKQNRKTISDIESWKKNNEAFFRLFYFSAEPVSREWGVGLARKTGMDEALRRFDKLDKPEGIILCLDADCTVSPDYFTSVYRDFYLKKEKKACSIYFEHPVSGSSFDRYEYSSIIQYELHLRYYLQALKWAGVSDVFQTVGSAMAVRAIGYMKAGGMNRKQAGEDFYFIQKLIPSGGYFSLNSTTVYPSPRKSFRVPFGTGATMQKLADDSAFFTYDHNAFRDIAFIFSGMEELFSCHREQLAGFYGRMPESLRMFMTLEEWVSKASEIRSNVSGLPAFRKRFSGWFNMFMIMKFLNFAHKDFFSKKPVTGEAAELLRELGYSDIPADTLEMLLYYRRLERS